MSSYTAPFFEFDIRDSIRYSGGASIIKNYNYENLILNLLFWDNPKVYGGCKCDRCTLPVCLKI